MADAKTLAYRKERRELAGGFPVFVEVSIAALVVAVAAVIARLYGVFTIEGVYEQALWFVVWAAVFLLVHFGMWFWRYCFLAPKKQHFDQELRMRALEAKQEEKYKTYTASITGVQSENARLKAMLEGQEKKQELADLLTKKCEEGIDLLNTSIGDEQDFTAWRNSTGMWKSEVITIMTTWCCSAQEHHLFQFIHEVPQGQGFNQDVRFNHYKTLHSERIKRLKSLVNRYAINPIF